VTIAHFMFFFLIDLHASLAKDHTGKFRCPTFLKTYLISVLDDCIVLLPVSESKTYIL
jgi:hypothetical protein